MLGNFGLRKAKDFLEVTDTKRTACQQMDDPQPRGIAETLVNGDQFHEFQYIRIYVYISIQINPDPLLCLLGTPSSLSRRGGAAGKAAIRIAL
jgi:hypothetical protein